MTVHPRKKFSKKIPRTSRLLRANVTMKGKKYRNVPNPKNGKKRNIERPITLPPQ